METTNGGGSRFKIHTRFLVDGILQSYFGHIELIKWSIDIFTFKKFNVATRKI